MRRVYHNKGWPGFYDKEEFFIDWPWWCKILFIAGAIFSMWAGKQSADEFNEKYLAAIEQYQQQNTKEIK